MTINIVRIDDPEYWEGQRKWVGEMHARLDEKAKPKDVTFNLTEGELVVMEEVVRRARELGGTTSNSHALVDVCEYYLNHGPHVGVMDTIAIRREMREARLEYLMEKLGPRDVIEAFNRAFPTWAIRLNFPM